MASTKKKTILFFGDQTDEWLDHINYIAKKAVYTPWLKTFMEDLCGKVKSETKGMEPAITESLGEYSSLYELAEKYTHTTDEAGLANAILIFTMRAAMLLQCIKREPDLLARSENRPEVLGISGGLMNLSALSVAHDFESLYQACLEMCGVLCRVCRFCYIKSRAAEDRAGTWGWAVLGISTDKLRDVLDQHQNSLGIPLMKRAHVGVSGDRWASIIGPPSVLEQFLKECPAVNSLPQNPLNVRSLQHAIPATDADLDYIVGDSTLSKTIKHKDFAVWGLDDRNAILQTFGDVSRAGVAQAVCRPLDITLVVNDLKKYLGACNEIAIKVIGPSSHTSYIANTLKAGGRTVSVHHEIDAEKEAPKQATTPGRIAIVGMAGRGPGSGNLDEFWDVIMSKKDLAQEVPADRFDLEEFFAQNHDHDGVKCTTASRFGCFMNKPGNFDARFFRISPREAIFMDPGHRQFLMSSYEALEMAGYADNQTRSVDPNRIGVFYGQSNDDWHEMAHHVKGCDAYTLQGAQRAFGAGRLAFQMKWEGPAYSLDSACASTSSCIHLACESLGTKDIDMAVVGAANIVGYPHSWTSLSNSGILSNTGNCKPFREDADGYCRADFVGSVVLKRLEDAVAQNDNILGTIAGSGRNHSGNATSITTSDAGAQERLFRKVLRKAGVLPSEISYIELHGTGTQTGDPAEIGAVAKAFKGRRAGSPIAVGSIKANIGHSEAAAGMSSLLKCLLMLQNNTIPPQGGLPNKLNPKFDPLSQFGIVIHENATSFEPGQSPRRMLLNNFDAAGGNACLLIEEYRDAAATSRDQSLPWASHVVVSSGKTESAFRANKNKLLNWLRANPTARIQDVAYTTTARRLHHPLRSTYVVFSTEELIKELEADTSSSSEKTAPVVKSAKPVVFVFTGQGSHYAGMGSDLYHSSAIFREMVDHCLEICAKNDFPPFLEAITDADADFSQLSPIQTQLAVLVLEIALAAVWASETGLKPSMVVGHSLGEYAALHVAGVLSLVDVLYLVGHRARLLSQWCEPGSCAMLAIAAPVEEVRVLLDARPDTSCEIACVNSPRATVVSGLIDDVELLRDEALAGVSNKLLPMPFAFHSMQMDPVLAEYEALARGVTYSPPKVPVASTLLAKIVDAPGTFSAAYLCRQMREKVDFMDTVGSVKSKLVDAVWLEIGPAQVCGTFVRATLSPGPSPKSILSTLEKGVGDWASISKCLARLYSNGVEIDWHRFYAPHTSSVKLLTLPTYSWDMQDFWITHTEKGRQGDSVTSTVSPAVAEGISTCAQRVIDAKNTDTLAEATLQAALSMPGLDALIQGHQIRDVAICPGSAFCDAAVTAAKYVLETSGKATSINSTMLAIHNLSLQRPLVQGPVGLEGELLTTATLEKSNAQSVAVTFRATTALGTSFSLGSCTVALRNPDKVQAGWDSTSYFIKSRMDNIIEAAKGGHGHRFQHGIFYSLFSNTVKYWPGFKAVEQAYVTEDFAEAAAEIVLPSDPADTRFTNSPYHGESLVHLAGFVLNANPSRPQAQDTTLMMDDVASIEQTEALVPGRTYFTFARVSKRSSDTATTDVHVFDGDKLVMCCMGLRFHQVDNTILDRLLGKSSTGSKSSAVAVQPTQQQQQQPRAAALAKPALPIPSSNSISEVASIKAEPNLTSCSNSKTAETSGMFEAIVKTISKATGVSISDLTDDTNVGDLGVDSIMAIEITAAVKKQTGDDLPVSFMMEYPTIRDLRREFGASIDSDASASDPESPASSSASSFQSPASSSAEWLVVNERAGVISMDSTPGINTPGPGDEPVHASPSALRKALLNSQETPQARITLLHGRKKSGKTPLYLIADGTGSVATYIHLPPFKSKLAVYGVDSPFLRCPDRMQPETAIQDAAASIVKAILKQQQAGGGGAFYVGGFSGGGMMSYEVCRQLGASGRPAAGLVIIDICCPRTKVDESLIKVSPETGLRMFQAVASRGTLWDTDDSNSPSMRHLLAVIKAVTAYHPTALAENERPAKTVVIWAERGLVGRCRDDPELMKMLRDDGFATEAYPGFMEDMTLGALAWGVPHKYEDKERGLGPNGWDKYVGDTLCLSVNADHIDMPLPGHIQKLHVALEKALAYLDGSE